MTTFRKTAATFLLVTLASLGLMSCSQDDQKAVNSDKDAGPEMLTDPFLGHDRAEFVFIGSLLKLRANMTAEDKTAILDFEKSTLKNNNYSNAQITTYQDCADEYGTPSDGLTEIGRIDLQMRCMSGEIPTPSSKMGS